MSVGLVVAWLIGISGTDACNEDFFPANSMRVEDSAGGHARPDRTREDWDGAARFHRCRLAEELESLAETSMLSGKANTEFRVLIERADGALLLARARGNAVVVKRHQGGRETKTKEFHAVLSDESTKELWTLVAALHLEPAPGLRPSKAFGPGMAPVHPVSWLAEVRRQGAYGYGWFEDPVIATNGGAELIRAVRLIVAAASPELLPQISDEQVTTHVDGGF